MSAGCLPVDAAASFTPSYSCLQLQQTPTSTNMYVRPPLLHLAIGYNFANRITAATAAELTAAASAAATARTAHVLLDSTH